VPPSILLSQVPDWDLFESIAERLARFTGGEWISKLDGVDQRYWDLGRIGVFRSELDERTPSGEADACSASTMTLHLDPYMGIELYGAIEMLTPEQIAEIIADPSGRGPKDSGRSA
jgi:hypothetical protein